MPAMMNSDVQTNPAVIPDALRRGTLLRRSGIAIRRRRPCFKRSRVSGGSSKMLPRPRRRSNYNLRAFARGGIRDDAKQSNGAPHFGFFRLKPGKSSDAKGENGAPHLPAGRNGAVKNKGSAQNKKGAAEATPFRPLSRDVEAHPNPVRIRMLSGAAVGRKRCRLRPPPLDLLGAASGQDRRHCLLAASSRSASPLAGFPAFDAARRFTA